MDVIEVAVSVARDDGLHLGVLAAVSLAGLRHGFDLDHIAAITDISSSQTDRRRSLFLSTVYISGHALVLLVLGSLAVVAGRRIPQTLDSFMGRAIGFTLIALGLYVVYSIGRFRRDFRLQSRWMLLFAALRRTVAWLKRSTVDRIEIEHTHDHPVEGHHHRHLAGRATGATGGSVDTALTVRTTTHVHPHKHVVAVPADPFTEYGVTTAFGVGAIHGVGAETPTQVLLFTAAAGVTGAVGGLLVLLAFLGGLIVGNSILAIAASAGFSQGRRMPRIYIGIAGITAVISIAVGLSYLFQRPDLLPRFLGGG